MYEEPSRVINGVWRKESSGRPSRAPCWRGQAGTAQGVLRPVAVVMPPLQNHQWEHGAILSGRAFPSWELVLRSHPDSEEKQRALRRARIYFRWLLLN